MSPYVTQFARSYARRRATQYMSTDTCVITRPTPNAEAAYDPATRKVKNATEKTVYTGTCRLWLVPGGSKTEYQGQVIDVSTMYLSLPYDAPLTKLRDRVVMTASDDPALVDRSLIITNMDRGGGLRASRRMTVQFEDTFNEVQ